MLEKKTFVILHGVYDIRQIISQRESFGWQTSSFDNSHMYATRDINMKNIHELKKLELTYERAIEVAREKNKKLNDTLLLESWQHFLYHILIVPIIIHRLIIKNHKKKFNQAIETIESTSKQAKTLLIEW